MQALQLGAGLEPERKKRHPKALRKGELPASFRESKIGETQYFLAELHGIPQAKVGPLPGLRQVGSVETVIGRAAQIAQTPQRRKAQAMVAAKALRGEDVADVAERQLMITMMDSDPVTRLCGAYGYWQATGATHASLPILKQGVQSKDVEQFELSATCLAHMGPTGLREVQPWLGSAEDDEANAKTRRAAKSMTVIVHGTFARNGAWYKPGGSFHTYIKNHVYADVYSGQDHFFWSGRYSDAARRAAAKKLVDWCAKHPATTYRFLAHSHGANVVNLATGLGLGACTLVHLSPPVHRKYMPDMSKVSSGRFFTIRPRVDPVVFVDGGAQDYRNTPVASFERMRICAAWGHSTSHEKKHWQKKNIPPFVKQVCP